MPAQAEKKPFYKRKLVWVIAAILLVIILAASSGGSNTNNNSGQGSSTSQSWNAEESYAKIQNGMTKEQVTTVMGFDPSTCSTSETEGIGTSEYCYWSKGFSDKTVSVIFQDGKVINKNLTDL